MFDIGFWELVLVFVMALVVLGPERLPAAARQMGYWVRRIRGLAHVAQQELERELKVSELRQQLKDNPDLHNLRGIRDELRSLDAMPGRSIQPPAVSAAEEAEIPAASAPDAANQDSRP